MNDLHDVGSCDSLHDEFESWIKEDFLGLGGKYNTLRLAVMTHGVYVPDHRHQGGSMRKSIADAAGGIQWTEERAALLKGCETIVTRNSALQGFLEKDQVPKRYWNRPDWKASRASSPMGSHSTSTDLPDIGRLRIEETSPAHGAAQFKTPAVPPALTPLGERQQMAVRNQAVTEQQGRTQDARFLEPDATNAMLHPAIPAPSSDGERQRMAVSSQDATVRQRSADRQGRAGFGQEQGHYAGQRQGTRGHDPPWDRPAGHEEVRPGYYGDNGGTVGQNADWRRCC